MKTRRSATMKPRFLLIAVVLAASFSVALIFRFRPAKIVSRSVPARFEGRLARPYGMAPAAFDGFIRACHAAHISPRRITQTIGDFPLSVGYHKRDGWVDYRGERLEYSAAVDLEIADLRRPQINAFLETLAVQGFAAWSREGGKWRGGEHIHAVYAPLPMKPHLRAQVRKWERERLQKGRKTFHWQRRWRRNWRA